MERKDQFIKWLNRLFRETRTAPPGESWDNISMQMDIDSSWEEISRKMAIDEGWENISRRLDAKKRFLITARVALSAAATVMLLLGISLFMQQERTALETSHSFPLSYRDAKNVDTETGIITDAVKTDPRIVISHSTSMIRPEHFVQVTSPREETHIAYPAEKLSPVDLKEPIPHTDMARAGRLRTLPAEKTEPTGHGATPATVQIAAARHEGEVTDFTRSTYLGISTSVKNTWLLNTATMAGLQKYELNTTLPAFGFNIGIAGRRQFSEKVALHGDLSFISQTGQRYNRYIDGQYVSENIMLSYSTMSLAFKYTFSERLRNHIPVRSSIYIGPYAALLGSAETRIDSEKTNVTSRYNRMDWGGIVGLGQDFYPSPNLCITAGLFFRHGFTNIYSGDDMVPSNLRYTNTGAIELFLSIQHSIGK